ncbi:ABC transporter permease [Allonocardiopsis opalescens]|uniref:Peptide/nickel transport system permease protein n=1 Tax=Allonocardiopsis opalescens TaxID=1144618 RepID=A0A2T0PYD5_9ACTN|nr:ABC transporter permease [Allonocardiopsis opalescens]PRX96551.1 peptide/nickel transport system permease protein [Allonocardiopsis opalescens]
MVSYILRRVATGLVLAVLVTFITFWLLSFSFDGVVTNVLGPAASPDAVEAMREQLGLNRPLFAQYFEWLGGVLRGDFGVSLFTSEPVATAVSARLGVTLSIVLVALVLSVVVSVLLGVLAASRAGAVDRLAQGVSLTGLLLPNLLIAIVLVVVFAINARLLPATGYTPFGEDPVRWAASITIPVTVLVINGVANMAAQVRGTMIGELRKDYVRTLRTRGVPTWSIVYKHALRNAAAPALVVLSLEFLAMLGGALIIENVFALPGFGSFAFNSSIQGDIPVIMGITVFSVMLVVGVNLLIDLVNGWLNPKARIY